MAEDIGAGNAKWSDANVIDLIKIKVLEITASTGQVRQFTKYIEERDPVQPAMAA